MADGLTREDLRALAADLKTDQRDAFSQLRQDFRDRIDLSDRTTGARIDSLRHRMAEVSVKLDAQGHSLHDHEGRLSGVERDLHDHPLRRLDDRPPFPSPSPLPAAFDVKRVLAGLGLVGLAIWGTIEVLFTVADKLHDWGLR